ncbi:MAG: FecR family protein [Candidatus Rifleibacteriota bacterium]
MKRTALCFLAVCFLFFTQGLWAGQKRLIKLDATLEIISGQVKLTRVGKTKTDVMSKTTSLYAGDLLETLRESKAVLRYSDGTQMRIKPRTLIEVQPLSIRVFKGRSWYKFTKRNREFRIVTPTLVAGIRGTEFEVAVSSRKKASVSVIEGAVAVKGRYSRGGLLLRPGFATQCSQGSELARPYQFDIEKKKQEWKDSSWRSASTKIDVNRLFLNYLNLKYEYGSDDSRTVEALEEFEAARKKAQKK